MPKIFLELEYSFWSRLGVYTYKIFIYFSHWMLLILDGVYLQSGLEESSFNLLYVKQIDYPYMYFKKSHDLLKMLCD